MDLQLQIGLVSVGAFLLLALLGLGMNALAKLAKRTQTDIDDRIVYRVRQAADRAVKFAEQTYVSKLRASDDGDGKLTMQEQKLALAKAFNALKKQLGANGWRELARVLGGDSAAELFAHTEIEAALSDKKALESALKKS